ncbi:uncharacterized protein LOC106163026 [Lingula anatina]|uniref:Uncharacterized protein LOC106150655 n=1 Tax=Lingula anatina TaxID=7574 RepID=A0A1S3ICF8_LINAN|nr:uncharacterized protein LOC106150655 [Lingula anatina]XP_013395945.1 uncharacterized protein LOC106163026 [Lingula anatina]|eukprot:XP_013379037.1 uncharacterized protein LOC106150655 [Lingula anatina]
MARKNQQQNSPRKSPRLKQREESSSSTLVKTEEDSSDLEDGEMEVDVEGDIEESHNTSSDLCTFDTSVEVDQDPEDDKGSSDEEEIDMEDVGDEDQLDSQNRGNMMLDVLAQVASETLASDPSAAKTPTKKLTARSMQSLDVLSLDQIAQLTDKQLLALFSDTSAHELKRNYTYTCYLMPGKCNSSFTSFGNENRARLQMRTHLLDHVSELVDEANVPGRSHKIKFTAEPVPARKKRLSAEKAAAKAAKKKQQKKLHLSPLKPGPASSKTFKKDKGNFTVIKSSGQSEDVYVFPKGKMINLSDMVGSKNSDIDENEARENSDSGSAEKGRSGNASSPTRKNIVKKFANKQYRIRKSVEKNPNRTRLSALQATAGEVAPKPKDNQETKRKIRENEEFILEFLSRRQPYHDHNYTTIFGPRDTSDDEMEEGQDIAEIGTSRSCALRWGPMPNKNEDESEQPKTLTLTLSQNHGEDINPKTMTIPVVRLDKLRLPSDMTAVPVQLVSSEEIVQMGTGSEEQAVDGVGDTGQKPYPPMPKSLIAKKGKMPVPEEVLSSTDEEEINVTTLKKKKKKLVEGSAEWERKMALKYIRELKNKKGTEKGILVCRLCKDKTFTATATLMYHYRSHAGIKPFVCLICNTTFTRQHSLNYHMLIHNNQSRFTCIDCGRKFRHPSHFKEHLRRHTGETPFECTDCAMKFKTRNTYKRHLKTRHGKLLTASGIFLLSAEEFSLVRTKPYKKTLKQQAEEAAAAGHTVHVDFEDDEDDEEEEEEEGGSS